MALRALILLAALVFAGAALSAPLRVAFWNVDLSRKTPGVMLRDILRGEAQSVITALDDLDADVVIISGFDYDLAGLALSTLNDFLENPYPHIKPLRPNSGVPSGFDLDGNGRNFDAADAVAFGYFPGQGGMAALSRLPFDDAQSVDYTAYLWKDLPQNRMPEGYAHIPLSSNGHFQIALGLPDGQVLRLLTWHGASPGFNRLGDENIRRNHDEAAFWLRFLDASAPAGPFILLGQANTDPEKGGGDRAAITALLAHPALQNLPDLAQDTVDYGGDIGPLRVAYILPSKDISVKNGGLAPRPDGARHAPLWLDIETYMTDEDKK